MDTVIYDGECAFCVDKVEHFKRYDSRHDLEFIPRQDPAAEERFPALKGVSLDEGIVYIDRDNKMHVAAEGIYKIAQHQDCALMRLYAAVYPIPVIKQAAQLCYRMIAANRRRLGRSCAGGTCKLPPVAKR